MNKIIREIIETVVIAVLIFVTVRAVAHNFGIDGPSMEPSFHTGEAVLVNKAVYFNIDLGQVHRVIPFIKSEKRLFLFHRPRYGEVVVLKPPVREHDSFAIKRVIGLPGDVIEIKAGDVYINGQRLDEPYVKGEPRGFLEPRKIPADRYFVMGDNRNNSTDSRDWGPIPISDIQGKAWLVYWPFKDFGLVPAYSFSKQ
ncbi:MAG: signal peptidase I [Chloroflexi bacterium]|nr:signal peptidase I [Chloroflexota bacterium]